MTIPVNLTHAEVGVFLKAVSRQMIEHDLCFDAALDGHSHEEIANDITNDLYTYTGVDFTDDGEAAAARADEIAHLTGEEAINFNSTEPQ